MLRANRNKGIPTTTNVPSASSSSSPTILPMFQSNHHQHKMKLAAGNHGKIRRGYGGSGSSPRRVKGWSHAGSHANGSNGLLKPVALLCLAILTFVLVLVQFHHPQSSSSSSSQSDSSTIHHWLAPPVQNSTDYDLIVLGAGPAGLSAALFGARASLSVLVLGYSTGGARGSLAEASGLENFPGFVPQQQQSTARGQEWLQITQQQASAVGVQFAQGGLLASRIQVHHVDDYSRQKDTRMAPFFSVDSTSANQNYTATARSVIVATGSQPKRLELPREGDLWGKFVHSCAICDGSSYRHKTVVVVGGGDAAVEAVLLLSVQPGTRVIWVHRQRTFQRTSQKTQLHIALSQAQKQAGTIGKIQLKTPYVIESYTVEEESQSKDPQQARIKLTGVTLKDAETSEIEQIACDGVFIMIGSTPSTDFITDTVKLDDSTGLVQLFPNRHNLVSSTATSVPGIFAAGEVTDHIYKQAITAAAAGAQAALDAERWIRAQEEPLSSASAQSEEREFATELKTLGNHRLTKFPLQNYPTVKSQVRVEPDFIENNKQATPNKQRRKESSTDQDSAECDLSKQDCLQKFVQQWPVVVFEKPWCPYCKMALEALAIEGVREEPNLHMVDLTDSRHAPKMDEIQDALLDLTGFRTVPNVFVGGKSIGGGQETTGLHREGKLKALLEEAKALR